MEHKNSSTESPESSPSPPSPPPTSSPGGAAKHLVGLPSRGLFSSTIPSSNLGGMRVYVCDHDTAPPEEQVIKTNGTNILIRALQINKEKSEQKDAHAKAAQEKKGKRSATRALESKSPAKRANTGGSLSTSRQGSSNTPSEKTLQVMTVEQLRAHLRERGLSTKGKKDELIARMKNKDKDA
ncbi:DET1- and DDB1-associated protein 1 N-terminal [Dioscorea alata]|uniref:DET1- and DDB1-associated protein 1 N-terminal n=1 Tax=Dioscorea alata TaxID=55571 RepID=A0ACB7V9P6_DIOAL|nr:DET1- and DDB1-associated protein 1 N-terminal [Dioscorea alata]